MKELVEALERAITAKVKAEYELDEIRKVSGASGESIVERVKYLRDICDGHIAKPKLT